MQFCQGENSMSATPEVKRETLKIRIKPEERKLIDRAAKTRGKNRTDFILEAARRAAEDAFLDQADGPKCELKAALGYHCQFATAVF